MKNNYYNKLNLERVAIWQNIAYVYFRSQTVICDDTLCVDDDCHSDVWAPLIIVYTAVSIAAE